MPSIQQCAGTAAALAATNPVVPDRQIVVETDTGRTKIGDGTTAWNSLPYLSRDAAVLTTGTLDIARQAIHPFLLMGG